MSLLEKKRPDVLIIDDIAANVQLLAAALADSCDIRFALSGQEGLELVRQKLPDLILLDVMMPDMDGYEVCDLLKHQSATREIPIIFVTAKHDAESETRALNGGAVDFIQKPINISVVRARVHSQLALQEQQRALQHLNAELELRVEERTQALSAALYQAQSAQRAKSNFLANISHEVRTPLNAIMGMSYILTKRNKDPELREPIVKVRKAGEQLLSLVNGILDMTSLESEQIQLNAADFDLLMLLSRVENSFQEAAQRKGLVLYREIDPALPQQLRGDAARFGEILRNLLSNAIKFSQHGCISLRVKKVAGKRDHIRLRLEVEDNGTGIALEDQARIFNLFEQGDNSSSRKFGGTGIGLALVQHLARLMGGEVGLSSAPGQGSTFWVTLDMQPVPQDAPAAQDLSAADWQQAGRIARQLCQQLEEFSLSAQDLWSQHAALMSAVLADSTTPFVTALDNFDFDVAADLLREALSRCPQASPLAS